MRATDSWATSWCAVDAVPNVKLNGAAHILASKTAATILVQNCIVSFFAGNRIVRLLDLRSFSILHSHTLLPNLLIPLREDEARPL